MEMLASENVIWIVLGLFLGPFVQEDTAVAAAAGLSVSNPVLLPIIIPAIFCGLLASDLWKYLPGKFARSWGWARRYTEKPKVARAAERMRRRPGIALMVVRFVPLARVPAYVAAGFVRVPYPLYAFWVCLSGALYVTLVFGLFHALGEVLGTQVKSIFPIIMITIAVFFTIAHFASKRWRSV